MLNTVFRQVSFFLFERKLHDMRAKGELSDEDISELWMNSQKESLGESMRTLSKEKRLQLFLGLHPSLYSFTFLCLCIRIW